MEQPKNTPQLQALLQVVSGKLGMQPDALRQELEAGKFDSALRSMSAQDSAKFQQVLANPQKLNQMMNSRQARALYEKLTRD